MRQCDSKVRLLQTAHELIWSQSYGSVGVDQICEKSGVKKGSFYHFFRSKSELTVAAYEYHWEQVRANFDRIFSAQSSPLTRLDNYFAHLYDSQREKLAKFGSLLGCPFMSLGCELSTQDENIRRMAQQIADRKCRYLEATLRDAMETGDIPKSDPKQLAQELNSYIAGIVQEAKIANDLRVLERVKPCAYRLLGVHAEALA
jgi:TetR/AcrR family transcriptional regulator, transcriptional repressor for nem operon